MIKLYHIIIDMNTDPFYNSAAQPLGAIGQPPFTQNPPAETVQVTGKVPQILDRLKIINKRVSDTKTKLDDIKTKRTALLTSFATLTESIQRLIELPRVDPTTLDSVIAEVDKISTSMTSLETSAGDDNSDELAARINALTETVNNAIAGVTTQRAGRKKKTSKRYRTKRQKSKRHRKKGGYTYKKSPTRKLLTKRKRKRKSPIKRH